VKVTVCELPDGVEALEDAWDGLTAHVRAEGSDLVLLPEMPFHRWLFLRPEPIPSAWREAVEAHRGWIGRLRELAPAAVAATRPAVRGGRRRNEAFVWTPDPGDRTVHAKRHLPDEPGFWEASWYGPGPAEFAAASCAGARIGFLICTELWFPGHARTYAGEGVHLLLCPRATPGYSAGKWLAAGRTAAVVAGAFGLSSNRRGEPAGDADFAWAGGGWIVDPDGDVLGVTSDDEPWITREVDPGDAEAAKETYPRYVDA
jgi:N-carbamoylputrescine amidase